MNRTTKQSTKANTKTVEALATRLLAIRDTSKLLLVQSKTQKAFENLKRARTLLEKAEQTAVWAEYYDRTHIAKDTNPQADARAELLAQELDNQEAQGVPLHEC